MDSLEEQDRDKSVIANNLTWEEAKGLLCANLQLRARRIGAHPSWWVRSDKERRIIDSTGKPWNFPCEPGEEVGWTVFLGAP